MVTGPSKFGKRSRLPFFVFRSFSSTQVAIQSDNVFPQVDQHVKL